MRSLAAALLGSVASGCFYVEPINQLPSIAIHQTSSAELSRGDALELEARYQDPDGRGGQLAWRAYACTMVSDALGTSCDPDPFYTGSEPTAAMTVAVRRASGEPVQAIRVELTARDDRGAAAVPQVLVLPVSDAHPRVLVRAADRVHGYVVGAPIALAARYSDVDDGAAALTTRWDVFPPNSQPGYTLGGVTLTDDAADPGQRTAARTLTPLGVGTGWSVTFTASDPLVSVASTVTFDVHADYAPCLTQWQPGVPPSGASLPVGEPTVFQIPVVEDDLDVYPPVPGDPVLRTASFAWSILPAGAPARQPLTGANGNAITFDPRGFAPGTLVELRVEALDRSHASAACADDQPTCPVDAVASCTQRQTWRLEIR